MPAEDTNSAHAARPRDGAVAIALHWLLALMIFGSVGVGLTMSDLPFSPLRLRLYNWHKWAGITILLLSALRLLWRLSHRPPALPATVLAAMPAWQRHAHSATHTLLYLLRAKATGATGSRQTRAHRARPALTTSPSPCKDANC